MHVRKSQDCHKGAVKGDSQEDLEERYRENFHLREYINNCK